MTGAGTPLTSTRSAPPAIDSPVPPRGLAPARQNSYDATGNLLNDGTVQFKYGSDGRLSGVVRGGVTTGYRCNGLGQRVAKTRAAGVAAHDVYDEAGRLVGEYDGAAPFGLDQPDENPSRLSSFTYNPRFPGQVFDKETNNHYHYFRDYDPQTRRYVQSDPMGREGGLNTYAYVENDPLSYISPDGSIGIPRMGKPPGMKPSRWALCRFAWNLTRLRQRDSAKPRGFPHPYPRPEGGEVLAAGRARGPDAPPSSPKRLSVKAFPMPSRVRCAGLRPPLTAPKTPLRLSQANQPCSAKGKMRSVKFHSKRHRTDPPSTARGACFSPGLFCHVREDDGVIASRR